MPWSQAQITYHHMRLFARFGTILKNVKNTHSGVLLLFTKSNTPPWVFSTFFKLHKWYQIAPRTIHDYQQSLIINNFRQRIQKILETLWDHFPLLKFYSLGIFWIWEGIFNFADLCGCKLNFKYTPFLLCITSGLNDSKKPSIKNCFVGNDFCDSQNVHVTLKTLSAAVVKFVLNRIRIFGSQETIAIFLLFIQPFKI